MSNLPVKSRSSRSTQSTLWIDGVGGYLMLDRDDVLIGQAGSSSHSDIGIVGDLSRQAAILRRSQSDYVLHPLQETVVGGSTIDGPCLLSSGVEFGWGSRVRLKFTRPHPLSSTARLNLASLHRFQPRLDGVLLLADSLILGPSPSCHVQCPAWSQDLLMYKSADRWFLRTLEAVEVNGTPQHGEIEIAHGTRVRGGEFSFFVE